MASQTDLARGIEEKTAVRLPAHRAVPVKQTADSELEIKFKAGAEELKHALRSELLSAHAAKAARQTLRSVYFDTLAGDLRNQQMLLRVRKARRAHFMRLKWTTVPQEDGPLTGSKIDIRVPSLDPAISLFGGEIAAELSRVINGQPLEQKFETQIKRRSLPLDLGHCLIEFAIDEGFIVAGDRRRPLTEIELRLKEGEEAALYDFAIRLADSLPVRLETMSKAERGFMMATGDRPLPVRAAAVRFPANATLDDAIETIIAGTLRQFVANWPALTETHHPESIHQMRVALRRLRTALAFFDRAAPCAEFGNFRAEAKRIAAALAPARDLDSFQKLVRDGPLTCYAHEGQSFEALLAASEERRLAAYALAQSAIDDPATTQFVLKLRAFLARRAWRNGLPGTELLRLTQPADVFARETLEWLHKRAIKRGRKLARQPPGERHRVRILLKKIRYTAEFFGSFFGGSRPYMRAVSKLQDELGAFNDAESTASYLRTAEAEAGPQAAKAAGIVLGWCGRGAICANGSLRQEWRSFERMRPFWR